MVSKDDGLLCIYCFTNVDKKKGYYGKKDKVFCSKECIRAYRIEGVLNSVNHNLCNIGRILQSGKMVHRKR